MYRRKYNKRKRHNGAILIAAILWGFAALVSASATLAVANSIFENHSWQTVLLRRENTAVQALAIAEKWFISGVKSKMLLDPLDFEFSAIPKDDPWIEIPADLMTELRKLNKHMDIEVRIADQNYSSSFKNTADKMGIPLGRPSEIYVSADNTSPDVYAVKRFQVRASVLHDTGSKKTLTVTKNLLVLRDINGDVRTITLYTKKQ